MDTYIKRADVINLIQQKLERISEQKGYDPVTLLQALQEEIQTIPAQTVRPVITAHWIGYLDGEHIMPERYYQCSRCGSRGYKNPSKSCPNCTALMTNVK